LARSGATQTYRAVLDRADVQAAPALTTLEVSRVCRSPTVCTLPTTAATEPPTTSHWGTSPKFATEPLPFYGAQNFYFDRVVTFTLDGRFDLLAQVETYPVGRLDIADAMVTLWRSNGDDDYGNDALIGGFDFESTAMQQGFEGLGSGAYFYLVEGVASGRGDLLFSGSIAAVLEPGQWALMLAGLA
jgi:hypothetical protein